MTLTNKEKVYEGFYFRRQMDRQIDLQMDGWMDRWIDRQIDGYKCRYIEGKRWIGENTVFQKQPDYKRL